MVLPKVALTTPKLLSFALPSFKLGFYISGVKHLYFKLIIQLNKNTYPETYTIIDSIRSMRFALLPHLLNLYHCLVWLIFLIKIASASKAEFSCHCDRSCISGWIQSNYRSLFGINLKISNEFRLCLNLLKFLKVSGLMRNTKPF